MPHKRLLSKLYSYGVNDKLIKWVESFLRDRSQKVKVNLEVSCAKPVLSGIPQGSVLGPLLFVIFINDLPDVCSNLCDAYLFADDAKLYKCITNIRDSEALNQGFINIVKWSENWLMKLNLSKCKVLSLYRSKNRCQVFSYGSPQGSVSYTLEHVDNMKDLGITMDPEFSFHSHIYDKINTAYKMLGII